MESPDVLPAVLGFLVIVGVVICCCFRLFAPKQRLHTPTHYGCQCIKEMLASLKQSRPSEFSDKSAQQASMVSHRWRQVEAWAPATATASASHSTLGAKHANPDVEESISGSAHISSSAPTDSQRLTPEGEQGPRPRGWLDAWAAVRAREVSSIAPATQPCRPAKSRLAPHTENQLMHHQPAAPGQEAPNLIVDAEDELYTSPKLVNTPNAASNAWVGATSSPKLSNIRNVASNAWVGATCSPIAGESFRTLSSADELGDGWVKIVNPNTGLTYCFLRIGGQHIQSKWECTATQSPTSRICTSPTLSDKSELWKSSANRMKKSRHKPHSPGTVHETMPSKQELGQTEKGDVLRQLRESQNQDEALRRKTFKAMTLRWHPDKHPDDVELATEVFQFLQQQREWYLIDTEVLA